MAKQISHIGIIIIRQNVELNWNVSTQRNVRKRKTNKFNVCSHSVLYTCFSLHYSVIVEYLWIFCVFEILILITCNTCTYSLSLHLQLTCVPFLFLFCYFVDFTYEAVFELVTRGRTGLRLILDGYTFTKYLENGKVSRWRCTQHKIARCPIRAISKKINGKEMAKMLVNCKHSHPKPIDT